MVSPENGVEEKKTYDYSWFEKDPSKAIFLNRFIGQTTSKLYLRCSFIDEETFCATSENGYLCVWHINKSICIQKQKISDFVLNDIAVNSVNNSKLNGHENGNGNSEKQMQIAVACDDFCVKII